MGGFDERILLKIETESRFIPDELARISPEIEILSQDAPGIVLAFASTAALAEFEARLTSIVDGGTPTYQNVLFALDNFSALAPADRIGRSLRSADLTNFDERTFDVELFPIEGEADRGKLVAAFESFASGLDIAILDKLADTALVLVRVKVTPAQLAALLKYRDVRKVDLPPEYGIQKAYGTLDLQMVGPIPSPPDGAPHIAILDSGVESAHPLLKSAVGDAQVFCSTDKSVPAEDDYGHGTMVAGIALYRDVMTCVDSMSFLPQAWILSGRVLDSRGEYQVFPWKDGTGTSLIENDVERAVQYFKNNYGCQIFNISFGDRNRVYSGGRLEGLAVKLDDLARKENVLFIVSTGNRDDYSPTNYPKEILIDEGRLLDPAPSLNSITVGGIARYDRSRSAARYFPIITDVPFARYKEPTPVTRIGPGPRGAIKPDFVEFVGNWARGTDGQIVKRGLGIVSTALTSGPNGMLAEAYGTSAGAPAIANLAARIKRQLPEADPTLIRAVLACHAHVPAEVQTLGLDDADLNRVAGYGMVDDAAVAESNEADVTMIATDEIQNDRVHFYELPLPPEFLSVGKRDRQITVALSHFPPVRSTRLDYQASRITFHLVKGNLADALRAFDVAARKNDVDNMPEYTNGRSVTHQARSKGSLQMSRWTFRVRRREPPKFVIAVTRNDPAWGDVRTKPLEKYSIAARISDRENQQANLYTLIRNLLRLRPRARA